MSRPYERPSLALGLAVLVLVVLATGLGAFERLELRSQSLRFALRGRRASATKIVLVTIDDDCLKRWTEPTVLWGGHYATALAAARRAGAQWVGFDVIQAARVDDYLFMLGGDRLLERAGEPDGTFGRALVAAAGHVGLANKNEPDGTTLNPNEELYLGDPTNRLLNDIGFVELAVGQDESVREASLYRPFPPEAKGRYGPDAVKPGFAAVPAARARGLDPGTRRALERLAPGMRSHDGLFLINYLGRPVPKVSMLRLAEGRLTPAERTLLRGAYVVIGVTHQGSGDILQGPDGGMMPGAEMHLNAIATLLEGKAIGRGGWALEACLALLLGVVGLGVVSRSRWAALALPLGMAVYALGAFEAFVKADWFLPIVGPLAALAAPPLVYSAGRAVEEKAERARVERVFGTQVGRRLRDFMLGPNWQAEQGGAQMEATVLFVDLRGSSAMARLQLPPETIATLNVFFDTVVPCVERHGGVVYAFLGDGLLAAFGAPIPQEGHAAAGLAAARESVVAVDALNEEREAAGLAPLRMGCGVHSGPLVCGNLGAHDRLQLTVVGDTVNTAARLESACKALGVRIVASGRTYAAAPDEAGWEGPTRIEPAGTGPIDVWGWL